VARGIRVGLAAAALSLAAITTPAPASAAPGFSATGFSATGDVDLVPGVPIDQPQFITLSPAASQVQVALPAAVVPWVRAVVWRDAADNRTPCAEGRAAQVFVCSAPAGGTMGSVMVDYYLDQLPVTQYPEYAQPLPVTITDGTSRTDATVHVRVRAHTELVLRGPYVGDVPPTGGGVVVIVENEGPSDSQGSQVTMSITGAVTSVTPSGGCTATGPQVTCDLKELSSGSQETLAVALGPDSGAVRVSAQVTALDVDPTLSDNDASGGPWVVFAHPGGPAAGPPVPVPARGATAPAPSGAGTVASPSPVPSAGLRSHAADPAPARAAAPVWASPFAHYLAFAFLCGSSAYLLLAGIVLLRKRLRRPVGTRGDLHIDLDR
jgi:uncharacterized protein DUF11